MYMNDLTFWAARNDWCYKLDVFILLKYVFSVYEKKKNVDTFVPLGRL